MLVLKFFIKLLNNSILYLNANHFDFMGHLRYQS